MSRATVGKHGIETDNLKHSKTLLTAIELIESFTFEHPTWGVRELGRKLNKNPSSIHRLVTTLKDKGYLEQDALDRRYKLGPNIMKLAQVYNQLNPLPAIAQKIFSKFSKRFNNSFYLIALTKRFRAIYLTVHEGTFPLKIVIEPGGITSLHSTAAGKVLLAYQGESYLEKFFESSKLTRHTSSTITTRSMLMPELVKVRRAGYATNNGEHIEEIAAVAVPVYNKDGGVTSSVCLIFPRHLLKEKRLDFETVAMIAKEVVGEIMGLMHGASHMPLIDS